MNKSKLEIFYSLSVLVLVPALLVINTLLLATQVRRDYDNELRSRSELANTVLASTLSDALQKQDSEFLQNRIDSLDVRQNELKNITLITKQADGYKVIASTNNEFKISPQNILQYDIVYARKRAVSISVPAVTESGQPTRAWTVASPALDDNGEVFGLVLSDLLTVDVDEKFDKTITRSILVMIASVAAILVLLFNHFRLIGYANLLRKQKELNQTMGDFLSVATHELKAPMTIIKGYIANVTDGDFGDIPDAAKEQLGVAVAQTERLNELVQDLLNVSRIEQGKLEFNIQPVRVTEIIETLVVNYQKIASEKDIQIQYDNQEATWVNADQGRVQEIFTNLIDNAVKYSNEGKVTISHSVKGKMLVTAVHDSGIGMSTEERARLFQRFYRVKNEKTKDISGTGLGLWIIKQYIQKMGGKIEVDSLVGSGTEFRVSLPVAEQPTQDDSLHKSD